MPADMSDGRYTQSDSTGGRTGTVRMPIGVYHGLLLVHGQVTIIFVVSVCLFVCLFVCAEFFLAVFDPIWIKLGHNVTCPGLVVSPRI